MKGRYLAFFLGVASAAFAHNPTPLTTVENVDLNRYVGKWYEIARYANRFEKDCASNVTADYTLRPDGKLQVVNQCRKSDGKLKASKGTAKLADEQSNSKLKVTFFWPFYGNYWIIGLDPEYRYAIVSEPKRKYLWLLARTPQLEPQLYNRAIQTIREKGFDTSRLIHPPQ